MLCSTQSTHTWPIELGEIGRRGNGNIGDYVNPVYSEVVRKQLLSNPHEGVLERVQLRLVTWASRTIGCHSTFMADLSARETIVSR